MTDVIAVVSKAVFEPELKNHHLAPGAVWPTSAYVSQNKALAPLASGGRLFLVTVRPPDEALWLVAVLENPKSDGARWSATNTTPIRDVSSVKRALKFESGAGLPDKPGVLGMSLQTPRALAATDIPLLLGDAKTAAPTRPIPVPVPERATIEAAPKPVATEAPALTATFEAIAEAWRRTRHPRFATVAEALAARAPARDPLGASNKNVDLAAWLDVERANDWRDLPRLLAALPGCTSPNATERVSLIARRDDPRTAAGLVKVAEDPPYTAGTSRHFWQAVIRALGGSRDVRVRDMLIDLSKRYKLVNDTRMGASVATDLFRIASAMKLPDALSPADEKAVAALEAQLGITPAVATRPAKTEGASNAESLYAAIVAAPDDDDARLIYADVLSERGDDRGEFILLQVERAAGRGSVERSDLEREKFLKTDRIKEFGLPLLATADEVRFERGFPIAVKLQASGLPAATDAPDWATVRRITNLHTPPVRDAIDFLSRAHLPNLDDVGSIGAPALNKMKKPATFSWSSVRLLAANLKPDHIARFPRLRRLEIGSKDYQPAEVDPAVFDAAPDVEEVVFGHAAQARYIVGFRGNPKLKSLSLGRLQLNPHGVFEELAIEKLAMWGVAEQAEPWLAQMNQLHTLIFLGNLQVPGVVDVMRRYPRLRTIEFGRYTNARRSLLERMPDGDIRLVLPPNPPFYAQMNDEAAADANVFNALGITRLVVHPIKPRHELAPADPAALQRIRDAWGAENVHTPELL